MAREEREMEELGAALEGVVGPRPASTLMRYLPGVPTGEQATKSDLRAQNDRTDALFQAIMMSIVSLGQNLGERITALENRMTRLEAKIDVDMATLESRLTARMNAQTITLLGALATIVVAITTLAFFR